MRQPTFHYRKVEPSSDHFTKGRRSIRGIILHATAGTNSERWLSVSSHPPVSIHVLVSKAGEIIRIVEDNHTAYHAGFAVCGPYSPHGPTLNDDFLGVELENLNNGHDIYPWAQLHGLATIHTWWLSLYGQVPLIPHSVVDRNKHDPAGFPWSDYSSVLDQHMRGLL